MSRSSVSLRRAEPADAPVLADLWADAVRRTDRGQQVADLERVIEAAAGSQDQKVVVAEYDGQLAGAVYLQVATLSPINLERTVQAISLYVLPGFRRRGVGRMLLESSVAFAEELGIPHLATAAASGSRDGNRFLARLGLGPQAVLRVATTHAVRSRLTAHRPVRQRASRRQRTQVLAARRLQRRTQTAG